MKTDSTKWINDYIGTQLATINFDTNWMDGYITVNTTRGYEPIGTLHYGIYDQIDHHVGEYVDKDKKIRDLEARVKELESILEEEI